MTVGHASLPNLVVNNIVENIEVQNEYLDYFTRNIQSFGSSSICVVSDTDETGKRGLKLASQLKTNHLWVVDFMFCLVKVCNCDCWACYPT